jgi:hypothetical protein
VFGHGGAAVTAPPAGGGGGSGGGAVPDDEDEDWTLGICIRCAQLFPALLASCPHCAHLAVTVRERASDPPTWAFKVTGAGGQVVMRLEDFGSATDAQAAAHEFLRLYVAQRVKTLAGGRPPPG